MQSEFDASPLPARRWETWLALAALLLAIVGLAAVLRLTDEPVEPLRYGALVWPPYEMAFLARDLGFYQDAAIELVDYQSPSDVLRAYHNGSVDVVAFTLDFALKALERDPANHHIVLSPDLSLGGDSLVASAGIASLEELRGRRVGIESSVLGAYMLTRAMEQVGASTDDVDLVFVDIPEQESAFLAGDVDAVVTYEPTRSRLLARGAREIFSSRAIPGEVVDVVIVNSEVLEEKSAQLGVFIEGWLRAVEVYRADPIHSASRVCGREELDPDQFVRVFEGIQLHGHAENLALLSGQDPGLRKAVDEVMRVMVSRGFLQRELDTSTLIEPRFIEAARIRPTM